MADYVVTLNKAGMKRWLLSRDAQDACMPAAKRIAANAATLAPIGTSKKRGELRRSHIIERGTGGKRRSRVWVVANTSYAYRVAPRDNWLQRAIDAARRS